MAANVSHRELEQSNGRRGAHHYHADACADNITFVLWATTTTAYVCCPAASRAASAALPLARPFFVLSSSVSFRLRALVLLSFFLAFFFFLRRGAARNGRGTQVMGWI